MALGSAAMTTQDVPEGASPDDPSSALTSGSFADMGLPDAIMRGIKELGYHAPTDVQRAVRMVGEDRLGLEIVGVGGVSTVDDAAEFFEAGAAAVMLGSSPMYLPDLAARIKEERPDF